MRLEDSAFKTDVDEDMFVITITQESDCSMDGGHSFEDVTNSWELNKENAQHLLDELRAFIDA